MTENTPTAQIEDLKSAWNKATDQDIHPWLNDRMFSDLLTAYPSTAKENLLLVIRLIKKQSSEASEARYRMKITVKKVLGSMESFDSWLQTARQVFREKPQTPRQEICRATGRSDGRVKDDPAESQPRRISLDDCAKALKQAAKG